jgi:hypothetical protein
MIDIKLRQTCEAYEILCRIKAGLLLAGRDHEGEYVWMGNKINWDFSERLMSIYE